MWPQRCRPITRLPTYLAFLIDRHSIPHLMEDCLEFDSISKMWKLLSAKVGQMFAREINLYSWDYCVFTYYVFSVDCEALVDV